MYKACIHHYMPMIASQITVYDDPSYTSTLHRITPHHLIRPLAHTHSLTVRLCTRQSQYLTVSQSASVPISLSISQSHSQPLYPSVSVSHSLTVSLCTHQSQYLTVSQSASVPVSLSSSQSLYQTVMMLTIINIT